MNCVFVPLSIHVCDEGRRGIWRKGSTSARENWSNGMERAFVFIAMKNLRYCVLMASMASGECAKSVVLWWE